MCVSSQMEKSYRSSTGSASPNRLSPSSRSGSNAFQSRGKPSSAPHSSPTPSLRHGTPSRKPSPPPSKASTPAPRSSTPTPRKISTGSSSATVSSGVPHQHPEMAKIQPPNSVVNRFLPLLLEVAIHFTFMIETN
ncbi:RUN/FYVE domain protein [Quillaja saponaria]|uniref:RUN/FYVE domain protein n=1 Tax=Quillaja saponaria TaxID=32244 RepID=A0AAD7L3K7_QUISA|nr:RUN/FYVE domain protein [Quillaja saponaria]